MSEERKPMDGGSKALIAIGITLLFMFLAMSLSVYQTRVDNNALKTELTEMKKDVKANKAFGLSVSQRQLGDYDELDTRLLAEKERVSILDESVNAKDKRWARIKRVRDAIEDTAHTVPPILELTSIASAVVDYSDEYDVPIPLILGASKRESDFQRKAVSPAGALGLMQVMPQAAKEIAGDVRRRHYSLFNVRNNVQFGTYYLRKMLDTFGGDEQLAIRAYNCGPVYVGKVQAGEYQNYPEETVHYLEAVLKWKKRYEDLGL